MDTAKVANVIFSHGGGLLDYEGLYTLPREDDGLTLFATLIDAATAAAARRAELPGLDRAQLARSAPADVKGPVNRARMRCCRNRSCITCVCTRCPLRRMITRLQICSIS